MTSPNQLTLKGSLDFYGHFVLCKKEKGKKKRKRKSKKVAV
jgi:hypothetical protein